jgi:hypothetical protein
MHKSDGFETIPGFFQNGADFNNLLTGLRKAGYRVERDAQAGTCKAFLDDECIFRALQFGRGRPWKVRAKPGLLTAGPQD